TVQCHRIEESNGQRALSDTLDIRWRVIASLSTASAAVLGDFGIHIIEREAVRADRGRFTQPRWIAIDLQPQRPKKPCLSKVIAGERLIVAAIAARVGDEQRRSFPGVQDVRADKGGRHGGGSPAVGGGAASSR